MTTLFAAVRPKRSEVAGAQPSSAALRVGEIATNLADGRIYSKRSDGTVIPIGSGLGMKADTTYPLSAGFAAGETNYQTYIQAPVGETGDLSWSNVALLLQPDGPNGATAFTDQSSYGRALTRYGNTVQSTAQVRYAPASIYFDGAGDYLQMEDATALDLSNIEATVELWFRPDNPTSGFQLLIYKGTYGSNESWYIGFNGNTLQVGTANGGSNYFQGTATITANQWHHVALTNKPGQGTRLWCNGQRVGTSSLQLTNGGAKVTVGCGTWNNPMLFYKGYIGGVRITRGLRWDHGATTYAMPTTAWQAGAYVPANGLARLWMWSASASLWVDYPMSTEIGKADDVASTAPTEGQALVWNATTSKWTPTSAQQLALRRTATPVTGTVTIDTSRAYQLLAWSGVNPKASFGAGTEGVMVELLNRSTNSLELLAGAGGSWGSGSGFGFIRPGGRATALYTGSSWSVSGDLYDPGVLAAFDLEDAQDYTPAPTKANGDLMTWDATAAKFTTRPLDYDAIEGQIEATLQLGQLANVTIANLTDQQYLRYNATSGQWEGQPLPLDQIAEDVQLRTNLGELANVVITSPSGQDLLAYNAATGAWVNIPGGDVTAKADKLAEFRQLPASATLVAGDSTRVIEVLNEATVTLPSNVSVGFQVVIIRAGVDEVNIAAATVNSADGNTYLRSQFSTATCLHKGAGVWYVFGDLKAEPG